MVIPQWSSLQLSGYAPLARNLLPMFSFPVPCSFTQTLQKHSIKVRSECSGAKLTLTIPSKCSFSFVCMASNTNNHSQLKVCLLFCLPFNIEVAAGSGRWYWAEFVSNAEPLEFLCFYTEILPNTLMLISCSNSTLEAKERFVPHISPTNRSSTDPTCIPPVLTVQLTKCYLKSFSLLTECQGHEA